jgi:hypothetical protein
MKLSRLPFAPRDNGAYPIPTQVMRRHVEWQKYLPRASRQHLEPVEQAG